jgi:hypothetical protein
LAYRKSNDTMTLRSRLLELEGSAMPSGDHGDRVDPTAVRHLCNVDDERRPERRSSGKPVNKRNVKKKDICYHSEARG